MKKRFPPRKTREKRSKSSSCVRISIWGFGILYLIVVIWMCLAMVTSEDGTTSDSKDNSADTVEQSEQQFVEKLLYYKHFRLPRKNRIANSEQKYLLFDNDCGGFNNIRIAFEMFIILAWITDRTLVIPPPQGWYLLDFGPQTRMKGSAGERGTDYNEFFDMKDLWQALPTISTDEFLKEEGTKLNIPEKFLKGEWNTKLKTDWKDFKWKRWRDVSPDWDPYNNVIIWPSLAENPDPNRERVARRQKIEYSGKIATSPVLNMASCRGQGWRFLGQVANFILYPSQDDVLRIQQYQLLKFHVHFKREIFDIASKVVSFLGMFEYTSLHIRRNELQYKENFISSEESLEHISPLLKDGEVLYVATDETKEGFFDFMSSKRTTYFYKDFFTERGGNVLTGLDIPRQWEGCIEQIICACGRLFFGTKASTFSSYIYRLHAYMGAEDDNIYIHNKQYTGDKRQDRRPPYGYTAVEYMVEFPYLWRILPDSSKLEALSE